MEKKNEEAFGWWSLEDDSLINLVVYMEGNNWSDLLEQSFVLARFQALIFGNLT